MFLIYNPIPYINLGVPHVTNIFIPLATHFFQLLSMPVGIGQHFRKTVTISHISLIPILFLSLICNKFPFGLMLLLYFLVLLALSYLVGFVGWLGEVVEGLAWYDFYAVFYVQLLGWCEQAMRKTVYLDANLWDIIISKRRVLRNRLSSSVYGNKLLLVKVKFIAPAEIVKLFEIKLSIFAFTKLLWECVKIATIFLAEILLT